MASKRNSTCGSVWFRSRATSRWARFRSSSLVHSVSAGFFHDEIYEELREARHREFRESAVREPSHAGTAYPDQPEEARSTLAEYMTGADSPLWTAN